MGNRTKKNNNKTKGFNAYIVGPEDGGFTFEVKRSG